MRNSLIIHRDPFREFETLFRQAFAPVEQVDTAFSPAADIHREGDDAVIRLELPGRRHHQGRQRRGRRSRARHQRRAA